MTNLTTKFAGIATLALAALPALALATAAHAAPAVRVSDIDLASASGRATFEQRAEAATSRFCRDQMRPGSRIANLESCRAAVQAELAEKVQVAKQAQSHSRSLHAAR